MNEYGWHMLELGNPLPNIRAVWIPSLPLCRGIEDAEVGLSVSAGGGRPLPASIIRSRVTVDEALEKEAFAFAPVYEEVFGEEARNDHADAIVHPTC